MGQVGKFDYGMNIEWYCGITVNLEYKWYWSYVWKCPFFILLEHLGVKSQDIHCSFSFFFKFIFKNWSEVILGGFPGGSDSKESSCNEGDPSSIPGLERSPAEGHGNPLQYSCLENPMDRGAINIEQSFLCYTVSPCWLSILNLAVSLSVPNSLTTPSPYPSLQEP